MRPVLHPDEAARLDREAPASVDTLMERAGLAVALAVADMGCGGYGATVHILAGPGNNGGDGYVAARHLRRRGAAVTVGAWGSPAPDSAAGRAAAAAGAATTAADRVVSCDVLVDALFGVGFRGELPPEVKVWSDADIPTVAVDVPSGLDAATGDGSGVLRSASRTVTFHALKLGHVVGDGPDVCGDIRVAPIGLEGGSPDLLLCDEQDAPRPPRPRSAHKWSAGAVMVVGGSEGLVGAAVLAARAALAFGAGAVRLVCPGGIADVCAAAAPEIMVTGVGNSRRFQSEDAGAVGSLTDRFDVVALGPGLGSDTDGFVHALCSAWDGPLVLDADGLTALRGPELFRSRSGATVVTPHGGEFVRLTGLEPDHTHASRFAADGAITVLLKGSPTFVTDGSTTWAVASGGPELATIGTGDVLTGMIAALWARGLPPMTAARSAAFWHGTAARRERSRGVTADRLVDAVASLSGVS